MVEPQTSRLDSLERRVERLTSVLIIQSVLLSIVVLMFALRTAPMIALCLLVAVPLLVIYRRSLPRYARAIGRLWGRWLGPRGTTTDPDTAMAGESRSN